jgi:predicted acylesterase/phospholipase RssA
MAEVNTRVIEPSADKLADLLELREDKPRILTFWSIGDSYPAGKLRYHVGQLGMLQFINRLDELGFDTAALMCDAQSRSLIGADANELKAEIAATQTFITSLKHQRVAIELMSQRIAQLHQSSEGGDVVSSVVEGALRFRNFVQRSPPPRAVEEVLPRYRALHDSLELDSRTKTYLARLETEYPGVPAQELLAALYASVRRPSWFDAFWLGDVAAWISVEARRSRIAILEANRSAYSWLTHLCFLRIGLDPSSRGSVSWPDMYFVKPIMQLDGKAAMELSYRKQAIFLYHSPAGLEDRLNKASSACVDSIAAWLRVPLDVDSDRTAVSKLLADAIVTKAAPAAPQFERPAQASRESPPANPERIALCLSGGGFRAAFFHFGVFALLKQTGYLGQVVGVYGVSGGSIAAAVLAMNWQASCSNDGLTTVLTRLLSLTRGDLRGRILRRMVWRSTVQYLGNFYARVGGLGDKELKDLPAKPEFVFLGTSMKSGRMVAFHRGGFWDGETQYPCVDLKISQAVAASSAFPALFPPLMLTEQMLRAAPDPSGGVGPITDGGVFDNLGVVKLLADAQDRADHNWCTLAIVSDASAPFEPSGDEPYAWLRGRAARAFDLLMNRVGELERYGRSALADEDSLRTLEMKIIDIVEETDVKAGSAFRVQDRRMQKTVSQIRTDLDVFSDQEVGALIRHGYEVALAQLRRAGCLPAEFEAKDPLGVTFPRLGKALTGKDDAKADESALIKKMREQLDASNRREWHLWSWRDGLCWIILGLLIACGALLWRLLL